MPYYYFDSVVRGGPWIQEFLIRKGRVRGRVGSERPVERFGDKLLLTETTTCFSTCERRSALAGQVLLCEKKRTVHRRVPQNICGYGAFIKKSSDIRFCRWRIAAPNKRQVLWGGRGCVSDHCWWKIFNVRLCPKNRPCWHQGYFYFCCKFKVEKNWGGEECLGCHEAIIGEGRRQDKPGSPGVTFFLFLKTLTNL